MYKVRKRDGKIVNFDISKISGAIVKAFESLEKEYGIKVEHRDSQKDTLRKK